MVRLICFSSEIPLVLVLVLASGFVLVTSKWARLFFIAFHLCVVIVVLKYRSIFFTKFSYENENHFSIFTAFIIDSFLSQYLSSQNKEYPWTQQEETINKRLTDKGYRIFQR